MVIAKRLNSKYGFWNWEPFTEVLSISSPRSGRVTATFQLASSSCSSTLKNQRRSNVHRDLRTTLWCHQTWLAGKSPNWRFLARKIAHFYAPFSSTPCLIAGR